MDKKADENKRRFLALMEENISLWSDEYLNHRRQEYFDRWCFDTGAPEDLARFEELDQERNRRKEAAEMRKQWAATMKEDPVWRMRTEVCYLK